MRLPFFMLYLLYATLLYYLFFLWDSYPYALGGSLIFVTVIGISHFFTLKYRQLTLAITLLSITVFSLMVLNFVLYLIVSTSLSMGLLIAIFIILLIMSQSFYYALVSPFISETGKEGELEKDLRIRIRMLMLSATHISIVFIYIASIAFMVGMQYSKHPEHLSHQFPNILILSFLIGPTVLLFIKRVATEHAIKRLAIQKIITTVLDVNAIKKWFFISALVVLLIGAGLEMMRGLWIVWMGSWLAMCLMLINIYIKWKMVFISTEHESNIPPVEDILKSLPSPREPSTFLKMFLVLWSAFAVYSAILVAILILIG